MENKEDVLTEVVKFTKQWKIRIKKSQIELLLEEYCSIHGETKEVFDNFYREVTTQLGLGNSLGRHTF